ncbi:hypothetical protein, partial [Barnesiella intestinihominis]|uniref:hypothetical protein n=1 Tax=Barnesiella intestinihominis TaxID=487174 RepID=UPI002307EAFB
GKFPGCLIYVTEPLLLIEQKVLESVEADRHKDTLFFSLHKDLQFFGNRNRPDLPTFAADPPILVRILFKLIIHLNNLEIPNI